MPVSEAMTTLDADLRRIFGARLRSLVTYAAGAHADRTAPLQTLAVVDGLTADDLQACVSSVAEWHAANLATPLLLDAHEVAQALDAFPIEFGAILASYTVVSGDDPFAGADIDPMHLRMACEVQARSHLLHLREDFLETEGRGSALADLIVESAPALAALVTSIARLEGAAAAPDAAARHFERALELSEGALAHVVALTSGRPLASDEARRLWPAYLDGVERLTRYVDGWRPA